MTYFQFYGRISLVFRFYQLFRFVIYDRSSTLYILFLDPFCSIPTVPFCYFVFHPARPVPEVGVGWGNSDRVKLWVEDGACPSLHDPIDRSHLALVASVLLALLWPHRHRPRYGFSIRLPTWRNIPNVFSLKIIPQIWKKIYHTGSCPQEFGGDCTFVETSIPGPIAPSLPRSRILYW